MEFVSYILFSRWNLLLPSEGHVTRIETVVSNVNVLEIAGLLDFVHRQEF
jgi:hypothetical protein